MLNRLLRSGFPRDGSRHRPELPSCVLRTGKTTPSMRTNPALFPNGNGRSFSLRTQASLFAPWRTPPPLDFHLWSPPFHEDFFFQRAAPAPFSTLHVFLLIESTPRKRRFLSFGTLSEPHNRNESDKPSSVGRILTMRCLMLGQRTFTHW